MKHILAAWGLADQPCTLHAVRENQVYSVGTPARFALRHHRPGLRTTNQIRAELTWMQHLSGHGLMVPSPQLTKEGELVLETEGQLYSLITWLPGEPLGKGQDPFNLPDPLKIFYALGQLLARMHALDVPPNLDRPDWTMEGLLGERPLWGQFWQHPDLSLEEQQLFLEFQAVACRELTRLNLPSKLIHADLLQENVLVDGDQVYAIDFDDCAYGYEAFDLTAPLVQRLPDPRFPELRDALLNGYGDVDRQVLALLFTVRCLTYVGWIRDKMDTPGGKAMSGRIVSRAIQQTRAFLDGNSPIL